jgi:uncharacterized protein
MQIRTLLTVFIFSLMTSCSFNKKFLQPTKIPVASKGIGMVVNGDTIKVKFLGENHQPTFIKGGKEITDLNYTIESVVFKSSNGNKLNGWFLKPKNVAPTMTLLHLHGNAGFMINQYQAIVPLLKNGFQIFMFDYSGFGFSEGEATRENVLPDALSALDYLKERPEVKNTKVVLYGQSYGGFLSATVASQREKDIDGAVIEGGFSSYKDIAAKTIPVLGRVLTKQGYSATASIKNYHKPLLVIHSTEDKVVPFALGKKIFDNANSPKEFFEIKHQHIYGPVFYEKEISTKIKSMFKN